MEKKFFEAPEVIVTLFEESDILTLSKGKGGSVESSDFSKWE